MSKTVQLAALGLIAVLQTLDVALRISAGAMPVLGLCVLAVVVAAFIWVATRQH